ncbi:MAG: hypothetical protein V1708_05865 [Candidatus Micrarchaeota archaeon]
MSFVVGFDSAEYRRRFDIRDRTYLCRGLIGIGVQVEDPVAFKKAYEDAMACVFKEFKTDRKRPAYCAAEISAIFGAKTFDREKEAIELFFNKVLPSIREINFFYTYLFHIDKVKVFGADSEGVSEIPVISREGNAQDFYDLMASAYPMVCAWKYSVEKPKEELLLDAFQGKASPAWQEFKSKTRFRVYYNGDRCNPIISTADLITRLVKLRMLECKARFLEREMSSLLPESGKKTKIHFLGSIYLRKMAPHKRTNIDGAANMNHPTYFIVRETPKDPEERAMIESTPAFDKILKKAFEQDAGVKFFHGDGDPRFMQEKDVLFTIGERGEKIAGNLKKLGIKFVSQDITALT